MSVKYAKVGQLQKKRAGNGNTVKLGNYSKNPKYATTVEIRVKDGDGNVLYQGSPEYLIVRNVKENQKEDAKFKQPDFVLDELFVVTQE